ncbi:MAG: hypothetical protein ACOCUT_01455 [bacterium]
MEAKRTMIASQLILEAGEKYHRRPTQLKFEELVDVVQAVVKNCSMPAVSNLACDFCGQPSMEGQTHCEKCSVLRII